ncbi:MAG: phenylalanine--tRNA ligase subunit alpha [Planctomycetota bacterium]|nr:MAG: phenylalanine--tRNA ligase subunit alpha [Planctomycetota bacterium]
MLEQLTEDLKKAAVEADRLITQAKSVDELRQAESRLIGKKGLLGQLLTSIGKLPKEQRAAAGKEINLTKAKITEQFAVARAELEKASDQTATASAQMFDPTLPGPVVPRGSVHPVTAVQWEVEDIMARLGFVVVSGPEMETDYYNFEALNIPEMHPARDMQDTFWLDNGWLLRTHTSPCQVRAMERLGPPLRVIAPGRCFRYETEDASHATTFHQLEGLMIDRNISIANLVAVMKLILDEILHQDMKIRLRPGYFPYVEPGFELDMQCQICGGEGCPTCKKSGWIEILPCGMVHPNVLKFGRIDPHEYTGFAFGMGLTRLAMMKYGVSDIRVLNSGDLRAIIRPKRRSGAAIIEKF